MFYIFLIKVLFFLFCCMLSVAFLTLLERKILGLVGLRLGPNKVLFLGLFQPISDAVKLSNKSVNVLSSFSLFFYYLSSFFMLLMMLCVFFSLDWFPNLISLKFSMLIFLMILGFNSLNCIISGWSAFSKFSLLGSIRTVAQLISYEILLFLCVFFYILLINSFSFSSLNFYFFFYSFFFLISCFYIWVPTFLAELNRTPYDFSEGESELVSGFNTEFGSSCFTLIFLAEYGNILFFCLISSLIFFFKFYFSVLFIFFVIWIRSVLPRYRFDKLMYLSWKFLIPFLTLVFCLMLVYFV